MSTNHSHRRDDPRTPTPHPGTSLRAELVEFPWDGRLKQDVVPAWDSAVGAALLVFPDDFPSHARTGTFGALSSNQHWAASDAWRRYALIEAALRDPQARLDEGVSRSKVAIDLWLQR